MGKRKRSQNQQDAAVLSAEEAARRQKQRELRELALKLRADGREYNKKRARLGKTDKPDGGKTRQKIKVAVLPIFWKQRPEEHQLVLEAARSVRDLIAEKLGVAVVVDESNVNTPGQRMKAWEEKGVKVRVEIGPSEARKRTCVLARAKGVGQVASKQSMAVGPTLIERLQTWLAVDDHDALAQQNSAAAEIVKAEATAGGEDKAAAEEEQKGSKKARRQEHDTDEDAVGEKAQVATEKKLKKSKKDKLQTHNQDEDAAEEQVLERTEKQKRSKKAKVDVNGCEDGEDEQLNLSAEKSVKKRKKAKVDKHSIEDGKSEELVVEPGKSLKKSKKATIEPLDEYTHKMGGRRVEDAAGLQNGSTKKKKTKPVTEQDVEQAPEAAAENTAVGMSHKSEPGVGVVTGGIVRPWQPKADFVSGDALDDDFGDIEVEAEEDQQLSKKDRMKQQRKKEKVKRKERKSSTNGEGEDGVEHKEPMKTSNVAKSKPKLVTF